jgi:hypothetical protein
MEVICHLRAPTALLHKEICGVPIEQNVGWAPEDRILFNLRGLETRFLAGSRRNQHHLKLFAIITPILLGQLGTYYARSLYKEELLTTIVQNHCCPNHIHTYS